MPGVTPVSEYAVEVDDPMTAYADEPGARLSMSNRSLEPVNDQESATCVVDVAIAFTFVGTGGVTVITA